MAKYSGAVERPFTDIIGENLSVLTYGAVGDGVTDDSPAFIKAITKLSALNGRRLYIPGGRTYLLKTPVVFPTGELNILLEGDGDSSVLKRGDAIPTGQGLFDITNASNVGFSRILVDGDVTESTQLNYSDFAYEPMADMLTDNTSFWVHENCRNITFRSVTVTHTGGYAILLDARSGDISDVAIEGCTFVNNRPHLFGLSSGDLNYGSWTGGIHYQSDGSLYSVANLLVSGCAFRRNTGNCVWGHMYALDRLHSNISVIACTFTDIGLDGVLTGGVVGGSVSQNRFRRVGYITTTDADAPVPKYLAGRYAVAIDTAGITRGVNYINNHMLSVNGGCLDLDGFSEGTVSGNTCIVPSSGQPEYVEDSIIISGYGGTGVNTTYGAQVSNTNNHTTAGSNVTVESNVFINMGAGAVRMYASRKGCVRNNNIDHPTTAATAPVILGNIGTGTNQRSYDNVVTKNTIRYNPSTAVGVVQEDATYGAFDPSDKNYVFDNTLIGDKIFEFYKNTDTASTTNAVFSSAVSALTAVSESRLQREAGYTRLYTKTATSPSATPVSASVMTVIDEVTLPAGYGGPLMNVTKDAGTGGVISTGNRLTSAFDDSLLSGKGYFDGFVAVANTTFDATEANLLADTIGLIRYNSTAKKFEQSVAVSSGARVWTDLGGSGGGVTGLTAGRVPYSTSSTALTDTSSLAWDNTLKRLTVTGLTGTASIVAATSYIQAQEGFYTPSTSTTAINVPSGGVTAVSLISVRNDNVPGIYAVRNSGINQRSYAMGVSDQGEFILNDMTASVNRLKVNTAGLFTIGTTVAIDQSGNVSASGVVAAAGVNVSGTAYNAVQSASGGMYALKGFTSGNASYFLSYATATMNAPGSGYGAIAHKAGTQFWVYNGSSWVTTDLLDGVTTLTGTANQVTVSASTGAVTLSTPQNIHTAATPTFGALTITSAASNAISVTGSVSAAGFAASGTATNQIQCASGGVSAKYLIGTTSLTLLADTAANAGLSSASQGRIYFDSSTLKFRVSQNGGAYVDMLGVTSVTGGTGISVSGSGALTVTNTGVTTVTAGTGVSVSATTGSVQVSIGQSVGTSNAVSFYSLSTTDAIQSNRSIGPAIYAPSAYIQGKGLVSSGLSGYNSIQSSSGISAGTDGSGGFYVGFTQVINTSGQFISTAGINVGSGAVAATRFNVTGGYTGQDWNLTLSSGTFSVNGFGSYTTLIVKGGVVVSAS